MIDFEQFAQPLDGESPCGPDCEYDNDFLALAQAVAGKPEQQFGDTIIPAELPDWRQVDALARDLLGRTRDLRVIAWLTLANTWLHGVSAFTAGLRLVLQLCREQWDGVHPRIEIDGETDAYLRMNAIGSFSGSEFSGEDKLIQALRATVLVRQPLTLSYRDAELAFEKAPEATYTLGQVESALRDALASGNEEVRSVIEAFSTFQELAALVAEKANIEERPDLERLESILKTVANGVAAIVASMDGAAADGDVSEGDAQGTVTSSAGGVSGAIQSREDVRRALDRVVDYLERAEPSNPAALFAKRAQRMLNMPFMDIMRELSPDSMSHLEMLTGVQPPADE